jgi:fibronectin type 3 domain-containing protein
MTGATVGSHTVRLSKTGYNDWSKIVKVTNGGTSTVDADLSAVETEVITTVPTAAPTTVKTSLKVTTAKVPTAYPKTTATTKASPVEGVIVLGAIGLGIVAVHRKQ